MPPNGRTPIAPVKISWRQYAPGSGYDEMITAGGRARDHARKVTAYLSSLSPRQLGRRQEAAEQARVEAERTQRATAGLDPLLGRLSESNAALSQEVNAIAGQLQLRLSDARVSDKPTQNVEAYRLYLRGRHHYQVRGWENLQQALPLLE